jgi:hypothetical protein
MMGIHHAPADAADWPDLCGPASFHIRHGKNRGMKFAVTAGNRPIGPIGATLGARN